jgi:predicted RNase H-like nuclease (RuvC/YqgF family)
MKMVYHEDKWLKESAIAEIKKNIPKKVLSTEEKFRELKQELSSFKSLTIHYQTQYEQVVQENRRLQQKQIETRKLNEEYQFIRKEYDVMKSTLEKKNKESDGIHQKADVAIEKCAALEIDIAGMNRTIEIKDGIVKQIRGYLKRIKFNPNKEADEITTLLENALSVQPILAKRKEKK